MQVDDLSGRDLAYWVNRANTKNSRLNDSVLRRHYGDGPATHEPACESSMRAFVASKFGNTVPERDAWR